MGDERSSVLWDDRDMDAFAEWFASLKPLHRTEIVESDPIAESGMDWKDMK